MPRSDKWPTKEEIAEARKCVLDRCLDPRPEQRPNPIAATVVLGTLSLAELLVDLFGDMQEGTKVDSFGRPIEQKKEGGNE